MVKKSVFAENYRPKKLDDVIGQDHVIFWIKKFVKNKHIPHMMFAGPAGVGKTTVAIALAREIYGDDWRNYFLEMNASVTPDTPIMIREKGKIIRTNFGRLAKKYFTDASSKYIKVKDIDILSIDKDYKIKFLPINLISRHKVDKIAKIKHEGGEISTSLNHSVIIIDNHGKLVSKKVSDLSKNDLLITFTENLEGKNNLLNFEKYKPNLYTVLNGNKFKNPKVKNIIDNMNIDDEIAWLFGAYLAEGCSSLNNKNTNGQVIFSYGYPNEKNIANYTQNILKDKWNLSSSFKLYKSTWSNKYSSVQIKTCNTQLANFFRDNFYDDVKIKNAKTKRVPSFMYQCNSIFRKEFLKGYLNDGTGEWEKYVRYCSVSKENLIDVCWLGRITGLDTSYFGTESRIVWKSSSGSYIRTNLISANPIINLFEQIDSNIEINWRKYLLNQLYGKKCKRINKELIKKLIDKIDIKNEKIDNILKLINSPLSSLCIKNITIEDYDDFVYDVSVPSGEMFWGGKIPVLLHNSDERKIEDVRVKVKGYAQVKVIGRDFKIIFMDECDSVTAPAQAALRRIIEKNSSRCRFILSCNFSNKIIEPIIDRCVVFRFRAISAQNMKFLLKKIAQKEDIDITDSAIMTLAVLTNGSMRRALGILETLKFSGITNISDDIIYGVTCYVNDEFVMNLLKSVAKNDLESVDKRIDDLLDVKTYQPSEIIESLYRLIKDSKILPIEAKLQALTKAGDIEFRISMGAIPKFQLKTFMTYLMSLYKKHENK